MKMFDEMADKLFLEAEVDKVKNMKLWEECSGILSSQMAWLSVMQGMSYQRVEIFDLQKKTLVDDLVRMKKEGEIAA